MLWKNKVAKCTLVLLIISSVANILYIAGVLPEMTVKIGLLIIMLSSCAINLCGINNRAKRKEYRNSLWSGLGICSLFLWLVTYISAVFFSYR